MFTPQEVSEKTFPKASGFNNGYGMAAVDEFLDALTEDYTALYKDNAALTHRPSGTRCSRTLRRRPVGKWPSWSSRWRRPSTS